MFTFVHLSYWIIKDEANLKDTKYKSKSNINA